MRYLSEDILTISKVVLSTGSVHEKFQVKSDVKMRRDEIQDPKENLKTGEGNKPQIPYWQR